MTINKRTAIRAAKACLWAYDFDDAREAQLLNHDGQAPIRDFEIKDNRRVPTSFAGIVEFKNLIIVAFQGTITEFGRDGVFRIDSLIDWVQNFRVEQLNRSETGLPGKVHEGFFKQLDMIYPQVTNVLQSLPPKPILVTGHSQGGAVANLATKRLKSDGFDIKETYTFGAPRCGDATFARSVATPVHRVEFGHDVVPHVPPMMKQTGIFGQLVSFSSNFFQLPRTLESIGELCERLGNRSYVGVGKLTFRPERGRLKRNLDSRTEGDIFNDRRRRLVLAGKDLVRHHGLDNYIGMFR